MLRTCRVTPRGMCGALFFLCTMSFAGVDPLPPAGILSAVVVYYFIYAAKKDKFSAVMERNVSLPGRVPLFWCRLSLLITYKIGPRLARLFQQTRTLTHAPQLALTGGAFC